MASEVPASILYHLITAFTCYLDKTERLVKVLFKQAVPQVAASAQPRVENGSAWDPHGGGQPAVLAQAQAPSRIASRSGREAAFEIV